MDELGLKLPINKDLVQIYKMYLCMFYRVRSTINSYHVSFVY